MSFMDKIKVMIGAADDEDYEESDEMNQDEDMDTIITKKHDDDNQAYDYDGNEQMTSANKRNKVVNIHATTQLKVVLVKPERFEDASSVADHLNAKRTVVLNLESTNKEISRRLVDFLSGVAYANNGQIKRVANSTFIITPYNVDIMGDLLDELENNGVYF